MSRIKLANIEKNSFKNLEERFVEFYELTPQDRGEATLTKSEQRFNVPSILNNQKEVKYE